MDIQEMHSTFRVLGQQMGMQLTRGILSESIDVYLNDAILEKTRNELGIGIQTATKLNSDTLVSTMTPTNTFRTLFKSDRFSIEDTPDTTSKLHAYNATNGYNVINIPTLNTNIVIGNNENKINPMMILGFSVEYDDKSLGSAIDCRLIGSDVLEMTLRDYCNTASKQDPIACLVNEKVDIYTNTSNCKVKFLNIKYIKTPNVVNLETNISCDLPDYLHYEIVEIAVRKFFASVGSNYKQQKD